MTPFEFGSMLSAEQQHKNAGLAGAIWQGAQRAGKSLMTGGSAINSGAKKVVRGFGNAATGMGHVAEGLGTAAQTAGRVGIQGGQRMTAVGDAAANTMGRWGGGVTQDVLHTVGHTGRLAGRASKALGTVSNAAGTGLKAVGTGLQRVADTGYGVPTAAAAGLLAGTSAVMPKLPLPSVNLRNPLDVDFNYKVRNPVQVSW